MTAERLKVLFITHSFPLSGTGPQSDSLRLLADALAEHGVDVRVVAPDMRREAGEKEDARVERFKIAAPRPSASSEAGSRVANSGGAAVSPMGSVARAARKTAMNYLGAGFGSAVKVRRDFEPDIVHAHWWFPSGLVGSWLSSLSSLPLVTSLHGFDPQSGKAGSPSRPLFRHVLRRSAVVTVESSAEAHRLASVLAGVSPVIAPLPLATDLFRPASERTNLAVVVSTATGPESAATTMAATLRSLASRGMQIAIVPDSGNESLLLAAIEKAGVTATASVVAAGDRKPLADMLGRARVCVVHGAGDQQRATMSAAMLSGAPLAVFDAEHAAELLTEQPHIVTELGGATMDERIAHLERMLSDEKLLGEQGESARMYALATLAPESCAARLLGVYLRALGDAAA